MSGSLGNTPAVCRKAYIHPEVLALPTRLADLDAEAAYEDHVPACRTRARGLSAAEVRLVAFLKSLG